ncbi:hypothetical protein GYMLUDRAFT_251887 [Collybiopsis luxurians FD-317 M1]|uniref:Uncharacterized protein n=1 Tax=Collybiopsis luxurians FD-317 M1 TaxID=944289 RepID=A0A0D0AN69_9AGAR|nr:hypothetical protein GYMLUDRAFT_251887 [Collybiopsis luxurians FD-317 M1]
MPTHVYVAKDNIPLLPSLSLPGIPVESSILSSSTSALGTSSIIGTDALTTSGESSSSAGTDPSSTSSSVGTTGSQPSSVTTPLDVSSSPEGTPSSSETSSSAQSFSTAQSFTSLSLLAQSFSSQSSTQSSSATSQSSGLPATLPFTRTHSSFPSQSSSGTVSLQNHHKSTSTAVIAGSVVGSVVVFIIFTLGIFFFLRRRRARSALHHPNRNRPETYNPERAHPGGTKHLIAEKSSPANGLFETQPSLIGPNSTSSAVGGTTNVDDTRSVEPIESELAAMRRAVAQVILEVQQLQAQIQGDETLTITSEAPPPTYVSG